MKPVSPRGGGQTIKCRECGMQVTSCFFRKHVAKHNVGLWSNSELMVGANRDKGG